MMQGHRYATRTPYDELWEWEQQERGLYAEPSERRLRTYVEVVERCNDPLINQPIYTVRAS